MIQALLILYPIIGVVYGAYWYRRYLWTGYFNEEEFVVYILFILIPFAIAWPACVAVELCDFMRSVRKNAKD